MHFILLTLFHTITSVLSIDRLAEIKDRLDCVLYMLDKRLEEIKNSDQPQSKRVTSDVLNSCKHYFSCLDGTR
jgi:hypothetical protein